jgi:Chondroitin N-acetylgalactosaminyltransferase
MSGSCGYLFLPNLRLRVIMLGFISNALLGLMTPSNLILFAPHDGNEHSSNEILMARQSPTPSGRREMIARPDASPVMVAILRDARSHAALGPVVLDTWAKPNNMPYDFCFFVGEVELSTTSENSTSIPERLEQHTIRLAAPDEYPPRRKEFTLFKYLHDHFGQFAWFMKIDIDSYLNARELEKIVEKLLASGTATGYIGSPGYGRDFERATLGLNPFCMGMGYLMGRETLVKLRPELDWCLANPHSDHSDTEMGNCIYKTSRATCKRMGHFINFYFSFGADGLVTSAKVEKNSISKQIHSSQAVFFGTPLEAVLVHALKKPSDMQNLHMQLTQNL